MLARNPAPWTSSPVSHVAVDFALCSFVIQSNDPDREEARMFRELFPIITSSDIERALGFYRDLLGFKVTYRFPEEGEPQYVGLELQTSQLGIAAGESKPDQSVALWVYARDCDEAVALLRTNGVTIADEPADQPWGERIATVLDPDGHRVIVGAP
jgi:lactoylglutathione lyase